MVGDRYYCSPVVVAGGGGPWSSSFFFFSFLLVVGGWPPPPPSCSAGVFIKYEGRWLVVAPKKVRTLARSHGTDRTNKGAWEPKNHEGRLGEHGL